MAQQVRAEHLEQIRLAGDYMRSLRYWLTVASSHRTLKARKATLSEHLARINALQTRQAVTYCCEIKLVGDSCQSNLREAIGWAETTLAAPTFKSWDCYLLNAESSIADALEQLDVVRSTLKSLWKQAQADMTTARSVIDTCAKDILHPVALPKAVRKELVRKLMNTVINDSRVPIRANSSLYFLLTWYMQKRAINPMDLLSHIPSGIVHYIFVPCIRANSGMMRHVNTYGR